MSQLTILKSLVGEPTVSDDVLDFYLSSASDVICEIRHTDVVEPQYLNLQVRIALELYAKMGVEGQTSHGENGYARTYESADISPSLIKQITPYVRTPVSTKRVIT